jgi:hypothetical protein
MENPELSPGMFYRKSENPDIQPGDLVEVHSTLSIQTEVERAYTGHHQFDWVRPRTVWFESNAPIFMDFGRGHIVASAGIRLEH